MKQNEPSNPSDIGGASVSSEVAGGGFSGDTIKKTRLAIDWSGRASGVRTTVVFAGVVGIWLHGFGLAVMSSRYSLKRERTQTPAKIFEEAEFKKLFPARTPFPWVAKPVSKTDAMSIPGPSNSGNAFGGCREAVGWCWVRIQLHHPNQKKRLKTHPRTPSIYGCAVRRWERGFSGAILTFSLLVVRGLSDRVHWWVFGRFSRSRQAQVGRRWPVFEK
jgi:hypothetical protein